MVSRISLILAGATALAVVLVVMLVASLLKPLTPRERFQDAAASMGTSTAKVAELRDQFERTILQKDRDQCNDTHRLLAGEAAVAYYETLLEQPFIKARLSMTRRNVCSLDEHGVVIASDPLTIVTAFRQGLRLPWDCLPEEWRTPRDLALHARLEGDIRDGRLTSEVLTGTLGLLARPWEQSPRSRGCDAKPTAYYPNSYKQPLPLLAAPPDGWSGGRRRRY